MDIFILVYLRKIICTGLFTQVYLHRYIYIYWYNYTGIFTAASQCPTVCEILRPINTQLYGRLVIDVICNGGFTWVKVVARNSQALHLSWQGIQR